VIVLVDVIVLVLVAVIDYPYPSGYGTAIGGTAQGCCYENASGIAGAGPGSARFQRAV